MKRIAQVLGVVGGLGAVVWAIRDRFVSVAISREPQPPAFRVVEPRPTPDHGDEPPSEGLITDVSGIGPVYATRLAAGGINSLADLAGADAATVAEVAQIPTGRAEQWIEDATGLADASDPS